MQRSLPLAEVMDDGLYWGLSPPAPQCVPSSVAVAFGGRRRRTGAGQPPTGCSAAPAQEPLPHPWLQYRSALRAQPLRFHGGAGIFGHGAVLRIARQARGPGELFRQTMMRHGTVALGAGSTLLILALAPPARALGVLDSSSTGALVPAPSVALKVSASCPGAHLTAIALAAVATAAQHDGLATASAQKHTTCGFDHVPTPQAVLLAPSDCRPPDRPGGRDRDALGKTASSPSN